MCLPNRVKIPVEHRGRTVLAMDCVLAGAEKNCARPLNSVYKDFPELFNGFER